jgi:hypothetical protein
MAACARVQRGGDAGYAFPEAFDATQAVTVKLEDREHELIASLSRRGGDLEVTLFDPIFSFPVLTASFRGGVASELRHSEAVPAGNGERLAELLVAVYEARYQARAAGAAESATATMRFRLEDLPDAGPCRFPGTVEVAPRLGAGPHVRARTLEVACGGPRGATPDGGHR